MRYFAFIDILQKMSGGLARQGAAAASRRP
jgi:hypothetical protein